MSIHDSFPPSAHLLLAHSFTRLGGEGQGASGLCRGLLASEPLPFLPLVTQTVLSKDTVCSHLGPGRPSGLGSREREAQVHTADLGMRGEGTAIFPIRSTGGKAFNGNAMWPRSWLLFRHQAQPGVTVRNSSLSSILQVQQETDQQNVSSNDRDQEFCPL